MQPDAARTLLGVTASASEEQIKRAWRELALRWHPDKNGSGAPAACSTLRRRTLRRHPHRSGGESLHRWWVARVLQRVGRSVLQAHLQAPVRAGGAGAQVSRTGGESLHHPHRMCDSPSATPSAPHPLQHPPITEDAAKKFREVTDAYKLLSRGEDACKGYEELSAEN